MSKERDRRGRAWVVAELSDSVRWYVALPAQRESWTEVPIDSLDDARRLADEGGVELEVDDLTYRLLVELDAAPAQRPHDIGTRELDPVEADSLNTRLTLARKASAFLGLKVDTARQLAKEQALPIRMAGRDGHVLNPAVLQIPHIALRIHGGVVVGFRVP